MKFIILFFICIELSLITFSFEFLIKLNEKSPKFCATKIISANDKITMSYVVNAEIHEPIRAELKEIQTNTQLYHLPYGEKGTYSSQSPLKKGTYELCFYLLSRKELYVSWEFYTLYEDQNQKDLASDIQVKNISREIDDIKSAVNNIESNARHLFDGKYRHLQILKEITTSIKRLTTFKILVITILSGFQVYVIQKFFGKEKRVTKIQGAFSEKNGGEFL